MLQKKYDMIDEEECWNILRLVKKYYKQNMREDSILKLIDP